MLSVLSFVDVAMACPNAASTVTIPYPSGIVDVTVYDQACVPIIGTDIQVHTQATNGPLMNGSTVPSVTYDASGFHVSANGAARGLVESIYIVHVPSGKSTTMALTVGTPVSSISLGTTSP